MASTTNARLTGPVRVVGAGLLGASIGLGLRSLGVDVVLADASPAALRLAVDYGAGRAALAGDRPALVVVCVPPDRTGEVVAAELVSWPDAVVADVASVKAPVLRDIVSCLGAAHAGALMRYVGSHPLAGRERGGPIAARADLFLGRPWVVCAPEGTALGPVGVVEDLILDLGATPVTLDAATHDEAVAAVSHAPQLVASLMAKQLLEPPAVALGLAGQGVRDVTRIAASDPELWVQILAANAPAVGRILQALRTDLDRVLQALGDPDAPGARRALAGTLAAGNTGVARLPGKHGLDRRYTSVVVLVDDVPGELGRLLTELGDIGVNMEDLRLEHSPEAEVGLAEISVLPQAAQQAIDELTARGWRITG
ncbi:MAG TPA: prephenate dehydrogenase [Microbacteriaceae bacterium]|nr:prephenate dehydrogenase [Microbacteriaceae bacterium]